MLTFILPTILALVLACLALRYSKPESSRLSERRERLLVSVQIICGDCSGDAARPVRTCLDSSGRRCERCGGTSYTLASSIASAARHAMTKRLSASEIVLPSARVLSFESATARADLPTAKIA